MTWALLPRAKSASARVGSWERQRTSVEWVFLPRQSICTHHEAVIYDERTGGTEWTFQRGSAEVALTVSGRMRITAAEGVRAAVLADAGLTVASEWMFAPELKSGAVRPVLTEWALPR